MEQRVLSEGPLLEKDGSLSEAGYALAPVKTYDRSLVAAPKRSIKEWDYYMVSDGGAAIAFTISDLGFLGFHSVALMEFGRKSAVTRSVKTLFPLGKTGLSQSPFIRGVSVKKGKFEISYVPHNENLTLRAFVPKFDKRGDLSAEIELYGYPRDSMVIATPFKKPKRFYYNVKTNCIRAKGIVKVGKFTREFGEDAACVFDFGRGVWTYSNVWYWATASGFLEGVPLGLNIGYGFGDTSAATENMIFYDGKAHKLGVADCGIPKKGGRFDYTGKWHFTEENQRVDLVFTPSVVRKDRMGFGPVVSVQRQTFGVFEGKLILDSGEELYIKDFPGSCEVFKNRA